jgi:hypothetical protein
MWASLEKVQEKEATHNYNLSAYFKDCDQV